MRDLDKTIEEMCGCTGLTREEILGESVKTCFSTDYNGKVCIKLQKTTVGEYWCSKYKKTVGNTEEKLAVKIRECNA